MRSPLPKRLRRPFAPAQRGDGTSADGGLWRTRGNARSQEWCRTRWVENGPPTGACIQAKPYPPVHAE